MRCGIMEMQLDNLIPAGLSVEQVAAHVRGFDHAALVRQLARCGFTLIELGGDLALFFPQAFSPVETERLAELAAELDLAYTVHLPLWSIEPSTLFSHIRLGSVRTIIECIQSTRSLQPEVYVLHATGALAAEFYQMHLPDEARSLVLQQFQGNARESLQMILAETGIPSRQLAIETIEFPFDMTLELADDLDLAVCLDTGHVLVGFAGPIDLFDALERCLPRLAEVHLHDGPWQGPERNIGYGRDHQPLGAGDLDLARLLDRLSQAQFTGPLIFELTVEEALSSLQVIRSVRPDMLVPL